MKNYLVSLFCSIVLLGAVSQAQAKEVVVVTSTLHIADFVRQIAGERLSVHSLLRPGVDPHKYEPTPRDRDDIAQANLCLDNGLHLEKDDWMRKLAEESDTPIVTVTKGVQVLMIQDQGLTFADPHAWLSLKNVSVYVSNILRELVKLMPEHGEEFTRRATLYMRHIRVLDVWVREQVKGLKPELRNLITSHAGFNYFCKEYGFNSSAEFVSIAPVGWSTGQGDGTELSPVRVGHVVDFQLSSGASTFFTESSVDARHIKKIAKETGGEIGGTLYCDSMGELGTASGTYVTMMRENVLTIIQALGK